MVEYVKRFFEGLRALLAAIFASPADTQRQLEGTEEPEDSVEILLGDSIDPESGELRPLTVPSFLLQVHGLISGLTQMGKTRGILSVLLQKVRCGEQVIAIFPHSSAFYLALAALIDAEILPKRRNDIWMVDLPGGAERDLSPRLDLLDRGLRTYPTVEGVLDALYRVWSKLVGIAPAFDDCVLMGCTVLIDNNLPLTELYSLLSNKVVRERLLKNVRDKMVVSYFKDYFDKLERYQGAETASTLRRIHRLLLDPALRGALANNSSINFADFGTILKEGKSIFFNLDFESDLTTRLWGSLLLSAIEQAALMRFGQGKKDPCTLFVDEFPLLINKSEEDTGFNKFVQRTAGTGLSVYLCHQDLSSIPKEKRSALSNCTLRYAFQLDSDDAEYFAPTFFQVDPYAVKEVVHGPSMIPRNVYLTKSEQESEFISAFTTLQEQEALVKLPDGSVYHISTPYFPDPKVNKTVQDELSEYYFSTLFLPQSVIEGDLERRKREVQICEDQLPDPAEGTRAGQKRNAAMQDRTEQKLTEHEAPKQEPLKAQKTDDTIHNYEPPQDNSTPPKDDDDDESQSIRKRRKR